MFSLEYTQLLTEGKDLQAETVAGMEEGIEEGKDAVEKLNHESGFIAEGSDPASTLTAWICCLGHWRCTAR
jgi:hypothetical protein